MRALESQLVLQVGVLLSVLNLTVCGKVETVLSYIKNEVEKISYADFVGDKVFEREVDNRQNCSWFHAMSQNSSRRYKYPSSKWQDVYVMEIPSSDLTLSPSTSVYVYFRSTSRSGEPDKQKEYFAGYVLLREAQRNTPGSVYLESKHFVPEYVPWQPTEHFNLVASNKGWTDCQFTIYISCNSSLGNRQVESVGKSRSSISNSNAASIQFQSGKAARVPQGRSAGTNEHVYTILKGTVITTTYESRVKIFEDLKTGKIKISDLTPKLLSEVCETFGNRSIGANATLLEEVSRYNLTLTNNEVATEIEIGDETFIDPLEYEVVPLNPDDPENVVIPFPAVTAKPGKVPDKITKPNSNLTAGVQDTGKNTFIINITIQNSNLNINSNGSQENIVNSNKIDSSKNKNNSNNKNQGHIKPDEKGKEKDKKPGGSKPTNNENSSNTNITINNSVNVNVTNGGNNNGKPGGTVLTDEDRQLIQDYLRQKAAEKCPPGYECILRRVDGRNGTAGENTQPGGNQGTGGSNNGNVNVTVGNGNTGTLITVGNGNKNEGQANGGGNTNVIVGNNNTGTTVNVVNHHQIIVNGFFGYPALPPCPPALRQLLIRTIKITTTIYYPGKKPNKNPFGKRHAIFKRSPSQPFNCLPSYLPPPPQPVVPGKKTAFGIPLGRQLLPAHMKTNLAREMTSKPSLANFNITNDAIEHPTLTLPWSSLSLSAPGKSRLSVHLFSGLGTCPVAFSHKLQPEKNSGIQDVVKMLMDVLRTGCNRSEYSKQFGPILNDGCAALREGVVHVPETCFYLKKKKMSEEHLQRFSRAFEISIFSKVHNEILNSQEQKTTPEFGPVSNAAAMLGNIAVKSMHEADRNYPFHAFKLKRNLVTTLKTFFLALRRDYLYFKQFVVDHPSDKLDSGIAGKESDMLFVFSLIDYTLKNDVPEDSSATMRHFEQFRKTNQLQLKAGMSEHLHQ